MGGRVCAGVMCLLLIEASPCGFADPPFFTDDPAPVDYHHWEFYLASLQEYAGHAASATLPHVEVNYGALQNVQLHLVAPMAYRHTSEGTHYGYAATEIGVKYRFVEETGNIPQIGTFPLVEIPTGDANLTGGKNDVTNWIPPRELTRPRPRLGKKAFFLGGGAAALVAKMEDRIVLGCNCGLLG